MKSFSLALLGLAKLASAQGMFELISDAAETPSLVTDSLELPLSHTVEKNGFGFFVEETVFPNQYREKLIRAPLLPFHLDYPTQEHFIKQSTLFHQQRDANGPSPTYTCDNREPGAPDTSAM